MYSIPLQLQAEFETLLRNRPVPTGLHPHYKKWLRFYLDFCQKYRYFIPVDYHVQIGKGSIKGNNRCAGLLSGWMRHGKVYLFRQSQNRKTLKGWGVTDVY
jgi:hypothetical protein